MTPQEFLNKWRHVELKERSASQSHFNDLCALLGVLDPIAADPKGEWFAFEKGATKTTGGDGWADVWRKGCFAWEYIPLIELASLALPLVRKAKPDTEILAHFARTFSLARLREPTRKRFEAAISIARATDEA